MTVQEDINGREATTDVKDVGRYRREGGLYSSKISMDTALELADDVDIADSCFNSCICKTEGTREAAEDSCQEESLLGSPL